MDTDLTVANTETSISSLPAALQQRILEASNRLKESSSVQVNKIRNDAKNFIFPDGSESSSFTGIIISAKHANMHYAAAYTEGISNPPDCFAIHEGADDASCKDLAPHEIVESRYAPACGNCPKFQWGSDKDGKGKGKACSEYVLLSVAVPSLGDDIYLLECKKGNAKIADGYIANVTNKFGHPIAVNTLFTMGEKAKWTHSFVAEAPAATDLVASFAERIDEANDMLVERVKGAYNRNTATVQEPASEDSSSGRKSRER